METKTVLTDDNCLIAYDHYSNGHPYLIVIVHGFFNSKDAVLFKDLEKELEYKYDIILLDFRGHGQSGGWYTWTSKEYIDLMAVMNDIRHEYKKIGLIGFSLGAATSIMTAAKVDWFDSVIAVSAPVELGKIEYHFLDLDIENDILYNLIGKGRVGKGVRPGPFWLNKIKPIDVVDKIKVPIYFIHGEIDWLIKPWHSQALYAKAKSKKKITIIREGPHAEYLIRKNKDETISLIRNWLQETL